MSSNQPTEVKTPPRQADDINKKRKRVDDAADIKRRDAHLRLRFVRRVLPRPTVLKTKFDAAAQ